MVDRLISTWLKSLALGFAHVIVTTPSPEVTTTFVTSSGGVRSVGGGNGGGVVPGSGIGRTSRLAWAVDVLPLASRAVNVTTVTPTRKKFGASFVTAG